LGHLSEMDTHSAQFQDLTAASSSPLLADNYPLPAHNECERKCGDAPMPRRIANS
jgi:hypothetical protein